MDTSKNHAIVRVLFVVAGLYDGILGIMFLVMPARILAISGVGFAENVGYLQFPAALLVVFAAMFFAIAARPAANRYLIPYGVGLKVAYCAIVFWHWHLGESAALWKPFAVCDALFAGLFLWAYVKLAPATHQSPAV